MSFDLRVEPNGEFPDKHSLENGWPNDEYDMSPFHSAKYVRDSDIITESIVDSLYGTIQPSEAVEVADKIQECVDNNPQAEHNHLSRLRDFVGWLRYWGGTEQVVIHGGP